MISLNFALASATVQFCAPIVASSSVRVIMVIRNRRGNFRHRADWPRDQLLPSPFLFQESSYLEFGECLLELLLRVHHDRSVPCDGLLKRLSRNQQEADSIISGLNRDFVALIEKDERAVIRRYGRRGVRPLHRFCRHCERPRGVAELSASRKNIGERMSSRFHRKFLSPARRD